MSDRVGQQLGDYRLVKRLDGGAFADVYLGEHIYLKNRYAALKILYVPLNDERRQQFLDEAQTLANLRHPHIVDVLNFTIEQDTPVLIMEYARGGSLRQVCPHGSRLPLATTVAFIQQIAEALQYAHDNKVIHRDVKPENILINASQQLLLSDFGIAVFAPTLDELRTADGLVGTLPYMAYEQFDGKFTFASDQYALAVVSYECLCGRPPFRGGEFEMIQQHLFESPRPLHELCPEVPAAVETVIHKALAKKPEDRFPSVEAFASALQHAYQSSLPHNTLQITDSFKAIYRPPLVRSNDHSPTTMTKRRSAERDANRQRLLNKVQTFWIKGILEQSLQGAALVAIGLQPQADAIANPWGLVFQPSTTPALLLPPGTRIIQPYDEANGALLILGAPGSGKTTLLLELTRELLQRAQADELHPIPAIFNLSSWAIKRLPIADWLVEELNDKYQVPLRLAHAWIANNQILPLLDGLDEVAATQYGACIEAINTYWREHEIESLVVCSRRAEYMSQAARIFLHNAVVAQPLTAQQIDIYLQGAGQKLAALRSALRDDPDFLELATNPLMLNLLILTYYETPEKVIISPVARQRKVFGMYIKKMLQRRTTKTSYSSQRMMHWLVCLAQQMTQHNQTQFYLERMQPDWLTKGWSRGLYNLTVKLSIGFFCFLACILPIGLGYAMTRPQQPDLLSYGLSRGLSAGYLFGFLLTLTIFVTPDIIPAEVVSWSWGAVWQHLKKIDPGDALICVFAGALSSALLGDLLLLILPGSDKIPNTEHRSQLLTSLMFMLICATLGTSLFSFLRNFVDDLAANTIDQNPDTPPRRSIWHALHILSTILLSLLLFGLIFGLLFGSMFASIIPDSGLITGLSFAIVNALVFGLTNQIKAELGFREIIKQLWQYSWHEIMQTNLRGIAGALLGIWLIFAFGASPFSPFSAWYITSLAAIAIAMFTMIVRGLSNDMLDKHAIVQPNQGIWTSARNATYIGLFFSVVGALFFGLLFGGTLKLSPRADAFSALPWYVLVGGTICGLVMGLTNGGIACIQHVVLRFFLFCSRRIPWDYPRFLDYAAEHILLRKVGGGYIFVHRLLLERFAELHTSSQRKAGNLGATTMLQASQKPLFALASVPLQDHNHAVVGKVYPLRAGVTFDEPEEFEAELLGTTTTTASAHTMSAPFACAILFHPGENVELIGKPYQQLLYDPRTSKPEYITCPFRVHKAGPTSILVTFYREQQWLTTMHVAFEGIEIEDLARFVYGR